MDYLEIPTWGEYQHYKDRCPPWIKLHFSLLSSPTWVMLSDASKALAIACMLIASRNDGKVPNDPQYIKRVAYLNDTPNLAPLIKCGFLVNPLADASKSKQKIANDTTETEERQRREEHIGDFDLFWQSYPKKKAKDNAKKAWDKKKPNLQAVLKALEWQKQSQEWLKDGGQYIPYPATYLNAGSWMDEKSDPTEVKNGKPWFMSASEIERKAKEINFDTRNQPLFEYKERLFAQVGITTEMRRKAEQDYGL